jgi:hypothetical protein
LEASCPRRALDAGSTLRRAGGEGQRPSGPPCCFSGRPAQVDDVGEATRGPGAPQSLRRKRLAGRASEAPKADDDFPAVLTPAEPGHAVRAERADELVTNDLRLGVWERHVQDAMAAIITALIVLHRTLSVAKAVPLTTGRGLHAASVNAAPLP